MKQEATNIYLSWYRDRELGQFAAECNGAEQVQDIWPQARLHCRTLQEASARWWGMLNTYGINCMTHYTFKEYVHANRQTKS